MSEMQIPVTDAFDDPAPLSSLEVKLTPRQIEWLEETADERGLSVDHVLRSLITAHIQGGEPAPASPSRSGDGVPRIPEVDPAPDVNQNPATDDEGPAAEEEAGTSSSIVDSLRSASERLQDLTDDDESESSDLRDTLSRLQSRAAAASDAASSDETVSGADAEVVVDDRSRSMFDMVEDDE
jgi:hypothetical protein